MNDNDNSHGDKNDDNNEYAFTWLWLVADEITQALVDMKWSFDKFKLKL